MASQEAWVGIADVAAHLSVAKDSIYRWVEAKCWQPAKVRHFETREIRGLIEVSQAP